MSAPTLARPHPRALLHRIVAVVTAAALAVGWQALTAPASHAVDNLMTNGGFESGTLTGWTQYPANRVQLLGSTAGHGTAHGGQTFASLPYSSSLSQSVSGLRTSQDYLATGWFRNDTGVGTLFVGLRYFDSAHPNVVQAEKAFSASTTWTRFAIPFRTDSGHSTLGILAQNTATSGTGAGYLDDVQVIQLSAARVSIQQSQTRAAGISQASTDPALWASLQSALAAADAAYWDFPAADSTVQAAAARLGAALDAIESPPVDGVVSPGQTTYYVSASTGDDARDGLSPATAWKTIAKIDASTFAAGDKILLKAGDTWEGTTLHPQGSGAPGQPITLGRYGSSSARPHIDSGDDVTTLDTYNLVKGADSHLEPATQDFRASVYLENQQYWVIRDLDVSNHAAGATNPAGDTALRSGILVLNHDAGTLHDIDVVGNNVHDVLGDKAAKTYWGGAGIIFTVMLKAPGATVQSNYDGILVEDNYVHTTNRQGIVTNSRQNLRPDIDNVGDLAVPIARGLSPWYPSTDVVIRGNYVSDVAGDGILPQVTEGALVEHNTVDGFNLRSGGASAGIWAWNADRTVFQENEASGGHTTQDGQGYDVDYGQTGTVYQYNYSHDNDGGFMLLCSPGQGSLATGAGSGVRSQDAVIRYNVSQDDRARTFMFSGYSDGALIYNNTIYVGPGINARPVDFWAWNSTYPTSASFYDNIFELDSAGPWNYADQGHDIAAALTFDGNIIHGVHSTGEPTDPHKLTTDPLLAAPGTGTTQTPIGAAYQAPDLSGYELLPGSPASGTGVVVERASGSTIDGKHTNGGRDWAGNPVTPGVAPDRGALSAAP